MIRLEHVTKTFNRHRRNRFIVANDISLAFGETGLVVILGASGSGKTTLLNIISGMDRFDGGRLLIDDVPFEKYSHRRWDAIRKHKIGYVNQNYHLLKELSVYRNIEPILRMQGIVDAGDIRRRVERLLAAVGLADYADRLVRQLSGGQQQRVAFARALANNPEVILADEPTGNLDGRTTVELMDLIREIAKTRLVVMVTHEQTLSRHYADRIVEIDAGTIVRDYRNEKVPLLEYAQEHVIELSDYAKKSIADGDLCVNHYTKDAGSAPLGVDLIERNQTLYLKVRSGSVKRTKTLTDDSEIIIREGRRPEDGTDSPFFLDDILPPGPPKKDRSVFSWKDVFRYAARRLNVFRGGGKLLFLVMTLVGMLVSVSVGLVGETFHLEEPYSEIDRNYVSIRLDRSTYADVRTIEAIPGVDQLLLFNDSFTFRLDAGRFYEIRSGIAVEAVPIDIRFLDPAALVYGSLPDGYGIVVDRSVADKIIRENAARGIDDYEDVLQCTFKLQTNGIDIDLAADSALRFPISGIADNRSQSVWMAEELMYSLLAPNLVDYRILGDGFEIVAGGLPEDDGYMMLNDQYPGVQTGEPPYSVGIGTGIYYISGIYRYAVDGMAYDFRNAMVSSLELIKPRFYSYKYGSILDIELFVYATDVETALRNLREAGYEATANVFEPTLAQQLKLKENRNFYLLGIGGILMSAFSILLIMRSSLIARLYEVSVYRSIGVSRREIRRIFLVEILLTTTLSGVVGFLLMFLLLSYARASLAQASITHFTGWTFCFGLLGIYAVNLLFGLIPIELLLMKTPSAIMKQSDI